MTPLPALNRRRLLLGLAAASTAGAAIAITGAATIAAIENPTLLRLGDDLPAMEAAYLSALAARRDAYRRGVAEWPAAPALLMRDTYSYHSLERDVAGGGIRRDGDKAWSLWTVEDAASTVLSLRRDIDRPRKDTNGKFSVACFCGKDTADGWRSTLATCEARLQAAESYYAKTDQLRELSGYEPARQAEEAARTAMIALASSIMSEAPATMAGIVIQAQALAAFGKVETLYRIGATESWPWAATFAANVLRIGEGAPAKQA